MVQKIKNVYHLSQAITANICYLLPWRKLKIIGVTGTDGKTTTTSLIYHILKTAGKKVALISTLSAVIDGKEYAIGFHVTTPRFFPLRSYIKKARELGVEYFVLEITSHALDQHRVFGIPFQIGVLTNITHEHLDYHKTYKNYVYAKAKLLAVAKTMILNKDDQSFEMLSKLKSLTKNKQITYALNQQADITIEKFPFQTKLLGEFNQYNILAAVAACRALHIPDTDILNGIKTFAPPLGRQQIVYDQEITVMIDFAHTPNAFKKILPEAKKMTNKRLIHVFGVAGKRDFTKRPLMGEASSQYADIIILTAEDPRSESVEKINNEIEKGITNTNVEIHRIPDRNEAIKFAVKIAQRGDIVLITGKGHEKSMNYGKGEIPWSDHEAVRDAVYEIKK